MLLAAHKYNEEARSKFSEASCEGGDVIGRTRGIRLNVQSYHFQHYLENPFGLALASTEANCYNLSDDHGACY